MIYTERQNIHTKQAATRASLLAMVAVLALSLAAPVVASAAPRRLTNQDRSVTATEVRKALQNTTGVLDTSTQTAATADADSAMVAATAGATVDVPKDAKRGVRLAAKDGASLSVGLPNAASAGAAQQVANGVVSYPSANGSANAVQTNQDGSVRMLTVIDNPSAPTRYDYNVSLPAGGKIELTSDGGAVVLDNAGHAVALVEAPWAKDAHGRNIRTKFITDGKALTQIVRHRVVGVVYPVTADPSISIGWGRYCAGYWWGRCIAYVSYPNSATITFSASDVRRVKNTGEFGGQVAAAACAIAKKGNCAAVSGFVAYAISKAPEGRGVAVRFGVGNNALSWWVV